MTDWSDRFFVAYACKDCGYVIDVKAPCEDGTPVMKKGRMRQVVRFAATLVCVRCANLRPVESGKSKVDPS